MRPDPVLYKGDMYRRLQAGEFGNTIGRYFTIRDWQASMEYRQCPLWGVQHRVIPGFPGTRLNVPTADVATLIETNGFGKDYVISQMVTAAAGPARWEGDVTQMQDGLLCSGNRRPEPGSWRRHMLKPQRWERSAARMLLRTVLNDNSYDDLMILLDNYPDHVIEFTALDVCAGVIPGRNAVVWEVRRY